MSISDQMTSLKYDANSKFTLLLMAVHYRSGWSCWMIWIYSTSYHFGQIPHFVFAVLNLPPTVVNLLWEEKTSISSCSGHLFTLHHTLAGRLTAGLRGSSGSWGGYTFRFLLSQFLDSRDVLVWRHESCWEPPRICNLGTWRKCFWGGFSPVVWGRCTPHLSICYFPLI